MIVFVLAMARREAWRGKRGMLPLRCAACRRALCSFIAFLIIHYFFIFFYVRRAKSLNQDRLIEIAEGSDEPSP